MLEVKHLTVRSKEGRPLVRDVSVTLTPGEPLGLTGASGSGKTTIIKAVMGILPYGCVIEAGEILLDGLSLEGLPARERREYCGTVLGFIPQSPMTAFDPHMRIGAQMVQTFRLRLNLPKDKAQVLAREQLLAVNLEDAERVLNAFPSQLSGGMLQQRPIILHIRKSKWRQHPRQNPYHCNYDRDNYTVSALYGRLQLLHVHHALRNPPEIRGWRGQRKSG